MRKMTDHHCSRLPMRHSLMQPGSFHGWNFGDLIDMDGAEKMIPHVSNARGYDSSKAFPCDKKRNNYKIKDPEKYTPTHKHTHPLRVYANVGPIYRWMHGMNTHYQWWCHRTYPTGIRIVRLATYQYFVSVRKWESLCTHYWVNPSAGLVYRWMHDVYWSISIMAWKIHLWISKLYCQSNIHIS